MKCWNGALTLLVIVALSGCDTSVKMNGSTDDGETLTGVATATGSPYSGTMQIVGSHGTNCIGTYAFEGYARGRADFSCAGGATGEAALDRTSKSGVGTIGGRRVTFTWR